jgi:truncated hemoglobin YjbI
VSAPERPLAAEEHALSTDAEPTLYEWLGGEAVLRELTRVFYSRYVMADPLIGPLFAGMAPDHPDRVADWLGEVFGGPAVYSSEHGGYPRMISQHVGRQLTEAQRARWASLMLQAADDVALPADPEFRSAFVSYIEWGTRLALANSQTEARPPARMPMPRWDWGTAGPPGGHPAARAPAANSELAGVFQPGDGEPLSFARHIRPLFRERDRKSMRFAFDLWSHVDVTTHADAILDRLSQGNMPCDSSWPSEHVETFRRWASSGRRA